MRVSASSIIHLGSISCILVGLFLLVVFIPSWSEPLWPISFLNVPFSAVIFLLPVSLTGLYVQQLKKSQWLTWMGFVMSIIGMSIVIISYIYLSLQHFVIYPPRSPFVSTFLGGLLVLSIGIIFFSLAVRKTNTFLSRSQFVTGILGGIIPLASEISGAGPFFSLLWIPFGTCWVLTGYALWLDARKETQVPHYI